jgi:hypothetical protein
MDRFGIGVAPCAREDRRLPIGRRRVNIRADHCDSVANGLVSKMTLIEDFLT